MKISPNYSDRNWASIGFKSEDDWRQAIAIFEDRIRGRYLEPILRIQDYPYAGFATMALDCLLIEALQQFRTGVDATPYKKSEKYFVDFLITTGFRMHFDRQMAGEFFRKIRCGILHQAEIKGNSLIRTSSSVPLAQYAPDNDGLIINRRKFHRQLEEEFRKYMEQLKNPDSSILRVNFRRKMDYVCRVNY